MIRGFLEAIIIVTTLVSMFMGDKDFGIKHYESYEPLCIESKVTDIKDSLYMDHQKTDEKESVPLHQTKVILKKNFAKKLPAYKTDEPRIAQKLPVELPRKGNLNKVIPLTKQK